MNAVMSEIRRLKTSWYATLPISRIPPEILSAIFLLCARSAWAPFGGEVWRYSSPTMREAYSWLHIYSVCRHWRDVASACPALWAWVLPADAALVRLAFERSSGCPLTFETIHLRGSPNEGHALTRVFHSCWSRIERVKLVVDSESLFANVDAPLLRSLRIWFNSSSTVSAQPLFEIHGTPNLSDLSWSNYMQWDLLHPLFNPRLESLRVQGVMAETPISAERWLDVLRNMPSLRRLYLDGVVSNFLKGEDVEDRPSISLPNLESFRMSTAFVRFDDDRDSRIRAGDAYIFARLYIPTGASIKYDIHRGAMADIDLVHIARKVSAHVADKQHEWMKIHYKRRVTTYSTTLVFETGHALTADKKPLVDDRICIGTRVDANVPLQISAHVSLASITDMQMDLQELSAEHTSIDHCNQVLRDMFRAAPRLKSLTLKGERVLQSFPAALQSCVSQESAPVSPSCVLPDLQVLTLEDAIWHGPGLTEKLLIGEYSACVFTQRGCNTGILVLYISLFCQYREQASCETIFQTREFQRSRDLDEFMSHLHKRSRI